MKIFYSFFFILAIVASIEAKAQIQIDTPAILSGYNQSDYIFEGIVTQQCVYQDSDGNLYTANLIQLTKIIKGNLTCGTVSLVTMGGQIPSKTHIVSDYIELNIGVMGVFLCKNSDYPQTNCYQPSNSPELMLTLCELGSIQYLFDQINAEVQGFNSQFPTLQIFYDFLLQIGITIYDCNNSAIESKRVIAYAPKNTANKANHLTRQAKNLNATEVQKLHNYLHSNSLARTSTNSLRVLSNSDLEFTLTNVHFINSNSEISIDINVVSNVNTTYLDGCAFRLKYNPNTFGTNISNVITANYGSSFSSTDYDNILFSDYQDSIITVYVPSVFTPTSRTQITTSPIKLMTIVIPVTNCKFVPNFKIDNFVNASLYTYYAISAGADRSVPGNILQYDNIITGATRIGPFCDPIITGLSKTHMTAGTQDQLTIYGSDFGTIKGTVFVPIADATPPSLNIQNIALDSTDITWSDNQITVKMPGKVKNAYYNGTSYIPATPGSGPITVQDAYGNSYVNSLVSNLTIDYVVFENYKGAGSSLYKSNQLLFSNHSDSTYHFKLHTNITNQGMIDCIKAAFRKWSCYTGVSFVLDNTTTSNNLADDDTNVIKLSTITNNDVLARTSIRTKDACTNNASTPFPVNDIDFEINLSKIDSFDYDTTGSLNINSDKYDFYEIFLHEMGHALQLGHLSFASDILYKYSSKGQSSANRRLSLSSNNIDAGDYVMAHSITNTYGLSCNYNVPIKKEGTPCRTSIGITEISDLSDIKVFPNPFNNNINISFPSFVNDDVTVKIISTTGKEVYTDTWENVTSSINIDNLPLPSGLYIISIIGKTSNHITKIICTEGF